MATETSIRVRNPGRVRAARAALLDDEAATLLDRVRTAVCQVTRSQIVRALSANPLTVTDLSAVIRRSKSSTSQHLRALLEVEVVTRRRQGRAVYYALAKTPAGLVAMETLELVVSRAN